MKHLKQPFFLSKPARFFICLLTSIALLSICSHSAVTLAESVKTTKKAATVKKTVIIKKSAPVKKPVQSVKKAPVKSKAVSYSKTKSIKPAVKKTIKTVKYSAPPKKIRVNTRPKTLETISTYLQKDGYIRLDKTPAFGASYLDRRYAKNQNGDLVFFSVEPELQDLAEQLVDDNQASHVAVVAIEPQTGRILALAEKSSTIADLSTHAGFPAASLFKVVTASAAIDSGALDPDSKIRFRGGTYELSQWNYLPSVKGDKRLMSIGEALGKSCNPVFGRIALDYLQPNILNKYAHNFGFGGQIPYEVNLPISQVEVPSGSYELSRTGAGFGDVTISPIHAATLMSGLANNGVAYKPYLIDKIISPDGEVKFSQKKAIWTRMLPTQTAQQINELMVNTTTIGTSRKEFMNGTKPVLGNIRVAGKTGTLKGKNPVGLNNWFIGAPIGNYGIAVASIVVDPDKVTTKASRMGRIMIQQFLRNKGYKV